MPLKSYFARCLKLAVLRRHPLLAVTSFVLCTTLIAVRVATWLGLSATATTSFPGDGEPLTLAVATRVARQARTDPAEQQQAGRDFTLSCPPTWEEFLPAGQQLWTCANPKSSADDFLPNCVLTSEPVHAGSTARSYVEASAAQAPAIAGATQKRTGPRAVGRALAYETTYTHRLIGLPVQVLVTSIVHAERAWIVTCSAPPTEFAELKQDFRAITDTFRAMH